MALYRELRRTIRRLEGRPLLWTAIRSGVVRRTRTSQRAAELQLQATAALGDLRRRFDEGSSLDVGFASLRSLGPLLTALCALEAEGAFEPLRRTPAVRFVIGQRLQHARLGPCIPYGWDLSCRAVEPRTAGAMEDAAIAGVAVDNRMAFYRIDADEPAEQPYYRVQLEDGVGHYAAQSLLAPVPRSDRSFPPIRGTSFFFTGVHAATGCLLPRAELAARYPDDVARVQRWGQLKFAPG